MDDPPAGEPGKLAAQAAAQGEQEEKASREPSSEEESDEEDESPQEPSSEEESDEGGILIPQGFMHDMRFMDVLAGVAAAHLVDRLQRGPEEVASEMPAEELFAAPWEAGQGHLPSGSSGWVAGHKTQPWVTSHSNLLQKLAGALHAWQTPEGDWELAVAENYKVRLWHQDGRGAGPARQLGVIGFENYMTARCIARSPDGSTFAISIFDEEGDQGQVEIVTCDAAPFGKRLQHQATFRFPSSDGGPPTPVRGLSFIQLGGQELLLAAAQGSMLFAIANPHTAESVLAGVRPPCDSYVVESLELIEETRMWECCLVYVDFNDGHQHSTRPYNLGTPGACFCDADALNDVALSPCGRWVAMVPDYPVVFLLDPVDLECTKALEIPRTSGPAWAAPPVQQSNEEEPFRPGKFAPSHYCAWSPDGRYLAVSFSHLHWVGVWGAPDFKLLLSIQDTRTQPLALAFSPARPSLLAFSERKGRAYLLDVDAELERKTAAAGVEHTAATLECLKLPGSAGASTVIHGLAFTNVSLLLATKEGLHQYGLLPPWNPGIHCLYPSSFKAAARALLMCACKGQAQAEEGAASVRDLPMDAVQRIVQRLADRVSAFMPSSGRLPSLTLH